MVTGRARRLFSVDILRVRPVKTVKPLEFYRLGTTLASKASSEAEQRTVVGRLYYGLHHEACCRFFREHPSSMPLHGSSRHADLRNRYNLHPNPASRKVGILLNDLRKLRSQADYDLVQLTYRGKSLTGQQFLATSLRLAGDLLKALESYSPGEAQNGCDCPVA